MRNTYALPRIEEIYDARGPPAVYVLCRALPPERFPLALSRPRFLSPSHDLWRPERASTGCSRRVHTARGRRGYDRVREPTSRPNGVYVSWDFPPWRTEKPAARGPSAVAIGHPPQNKSIFRSPGLGVIPWLEVQVGAETGWYFSSERLTRSASYLFTRGLIFLLAIDARRSNRSLLLTVALRRTPAEHRRWYISQKMRP